MRESISLQQVAVFVVHDGFGRRVPGKDESSQQHREQCRGKESLPVRCLASARSRSSTAPKNFPRKTGMRRSRRQGQEGHYFKYFDQPMRTQKYRVSHLKS